MIDYKQILTKAKGGLSDIEDPKIKSFLSETIKNLEDGKEVDAVEFSKQINSISDINLDINKLSQVKKDVENWG